MILFTTADLASIPFSGKFHPAVNCSGDKMQAQNLLVEEIRLDNASLKGVINSTLYEFHEPEWVSYHSEREGKRIRPLTILKEEGAADSLGNT